MRLYLKIREDNSRLSRLAYVEDDSGHLTGEEINRFVVEIIKFAPATL